MAQNYQRIGDYISVLDNRNTDGSITYLMGISIDKCYIPSVANVIGTDLHNYKVIRKGQFACSLMQVSRDQRIPLAMYTSDEPAIMSPAYVMFEVNRPDELLPEYLELWFKRAEFDREASFYAVGGVRGSLDWNDFCKMKLPVPPISEQRKIVHNYQVITDRIEILRKMNKNLEEQAQTVYKSWFEDFDPFDGEMPVDWFETTIGELSTDVICGKTPPTEDIDNYGGNTPFITIPDMHDSVYVVNTERTLSEIGVAKQSNKTLPVNSICVSCIATVGLVSLTAEPSQTNQQINSIICKSDVSPYYIYLKMRTMEDYLKALGAGGSATLNVNKTLFSDIKVLYPDKNTIKSFHMFVSPIFSTIRQNELEMQKLCFLSNLIMSNMQRIVS